MLRSFAGYLTRKRHEHKGEFDASELAPQFVRYFESGERIQVATQYDGGETYVRTGRVGVTSGWKPAFLLMHRSSDVGSGDVLGPRDRVIAVQRGRTYVDVETVVLNQA